MEKMRSLAKVRGEVAQSRVKSAHPPAATGPLLFVALGMVLGSWVGLLDAFLSALRLPTPLPTSALFPLAGLSSALLIPPGAVWGVLFFLLSRQAVVWRLRSLWRRYHTPKMLVGAAILVILIGISLVYWGRQRGIQVDALDFRPLGLGCFALVVMLLIPVIGHRYPKGVLFLSLIYLILTMSIGFWSASTLRRHEGIVSFCRDRTTALSPALTAFRALFDGDGDGFPTRLCDRDCDCLDTDPSVFPAAVELPGNGIDEDCNGKDLNVLSGGWAEQHLSPLADDAPLARWEGSPLNIVLITVDCLRADHLSSYGYSRKTSPFLDQFAALGTRFAQVRSAGSSTRHAFPTLLTGRHFSGLMLQKGAKWSRLLPENKTFAEHLTERGYRTSALVPYFRFKEKSGFNQGFTRWVTKLDATRNPIWDPTGDLVTENGLAILEEMVNTPDPWLLWLHYFDPHSSYVPHEGDDQSFGRSRVDRYDGEIRYTDGQIQRFLEGLWSRTKKEKTAVIISGDHGEALGTEHDHGFLYHGYSLFDTEIRIPLMIQVPGGEPRVIDWPVSIIDIAPTILDLARIQRPKEMEGRSLVPYLLGQNPVRGPIVSELPDDHNAVAIIEWPYKLIWDLRTNAFLLFDLQKDPMEKNDLHRNQPALTQDLADKLRSYRNKFAEFKRDTL